MRKKIALMLLFVFVLTGCGKENSGPVASQTPAATRIPIETFTVYSVDTDKLSLIPVQVRKKANEVCTAKQIVTLLCDNLAVKVKVQSVEEKKDTVIVSFAPDSEPVKDCSEQMEQMILECFANSLLDNVDACSKVVFRKGGKAYKSENMELGLNEVYASE